MRLSRDRADGVRALLMQKLDEKIQLTTIGAGTKEPVREERTELDKEANRSVTVRITLTDVS
jgi:outer membrane protein OmpA-like peptidoglycan-associated protein